MRRLSLVGFILVALSSIAALSWSLAGPPSDHAAATSGAAPYPWETNSGFAIRLALENLICVDIKEQKFENVLASLARRTGVNIAPNWAALSASAIEKDMEVNLRASNVSAGGVLDLILADVGGGETELAYCIEENVVRVSTLEDLSRYRVLVTYDCEQLLNLEERRLAEHIGRVIDAVAKSGGLTTSTMRPELVRLIREVHQQTREQFRNDLATAIQTAIDPDSWREAGGNVGSLNFVGDKMIIMQTRTAHMKIFELLERLRSQS